MNYIRLKISQEVLDEIEHITSALPGKVYYSDDGEALILADNGTYIVAVDPPDVILEGFNNGNPTTQSAYLASMPVEEIVSADPHSADPGEYIGWSTGWEC